MDWKSKKMKCKKTQYMAKNKEENVFLFWKKGGRFLGKTGKI